MTSVLRRVNNFKSTLKNKLLVDIVERIISSYPMSFINLQRLRKEVDNLTELFWIKDEEGKYILVNDKFASNFHLNPSQIEGKPEEKFIPAYIINFNKALEDYIKESRSVFIIEGFPLSGVPSGDELQTIEIPVAGSEGSLSAIIGIVQKTEVKEKTISLSSSLLLFKDILKNYILINNENKITDVSAEFIKIFSLKSEELIGKNFDSDTSGIPVILRMVIGDFIESGKKTQTTKINIPGMLENEFHLNFIKGNEEEKLVLIEVLHSAETSQSLPDSDSRMYNLLIQINPDPVFIYDTENLRFLNVNEPALKLYGYRKDEFLQLDLTDLYTPDDIQTLLEPSGDKFKDGQYSIPHRQKRKDGANIFVEINRLQINYNNKPAYLNTLKNINDKLKLEKERQHFNASFSNSTDLIFITDSKGFIKSVNNSVKTTLEYSSKNIIDTSFTSLMADNDRGRINSAVFLAGLKEVLTIETSFKRNGKEDLKVKLIVNPIFNYNNEVDSYNLIGSYINEKIIEIIKEAPVEKEVVISSVPEINFLSGIFHDLLTPINIILGFVQDLTENIEQPTSEQVEALEIINQSRENLLELINHIIEFVQTEKGEVNLNYQRVKIIDVIEKIKNEIDAYKVLEDGELAYGKISSSLEVETDEDKIRRLFVLLISLIYKITGQKKLFISTVIVDEDRFAICLKDSYNTTSRLFLEKMAAVFSEKSKNIKVPGIFSFSHKLFQNILNILNGEFKISKEKDKTDALFIFPLELKVQFSGKEVKKEDEILSDITSETDLKHKGEKIIQQYNYESEKIGLKKNLESSKKSPIDLSKLRCLYIEDQLDSQMLFSVHMKDIKEIDFAVSLEQAVPILKSKSFDFIVIDINLQGDYNGLDILRIIRTMPQYENTPVIAVTAYLLPINRDVYTQAGFSDFVSKPLFRENLISSLEKTLIPQD